MYDETKLIEKLHAYTQKNMPKLPYHNFEHVLEVVSAANEFGSNLIARSKINTHDKFLLICAAYLHDIVYIPGRKDNEEKSCIKAEKKLTSLDFNEFDIQRIKILIMSTKLGTEPATLLEQTLKDADLWNIGTTQFLDNNQRFRHEMPEMSDEEWNSMTIKFLESNEFRTDPAREMLESQRRNNLNMMIEMQKTLKEKSPKSS